MVDVGLPVPSIKGTGYFACPDPLLLSRSSEIGQLIIYSNYIGVVSEITIDYVRINTKYNSRCSNLKNTEPIVINDAVIIGKTIIID